MSSKTSCLISTTYCTIILVLAVHVSGEFISPWITCYVLFKDVWWAAWSERLVLVNSGMFSFRWFRLQKGKSLKLIWKLDSMPSCTPHFPRDLCLLENFLYIQCKARWIVAITVTCAWAGVYLLAHSYDVHQGYWKIACCQWRGISVHKFLRPLLPYIFLLLPEKNTKK